MAIEILKAEDIIGHCRVCLRLTAISDKEYVVKTLSKVTAECLTWVSEPGVPEGWNVNVPGVPAAQVRELLAKDGEFRVPE